MEDLIFSTVVGSHLYGLAHEDSDLDVCEVYEGKSLYLRQHKVGLHDSVRGTLDAFLKRAYSGSPQTVEALFSQQKQWAPGMYEKYGAFLGGLHIGGSEVFAKYERIIKKFSYLDYKRRRHAARLSLNLHSLRSQGRFNPELTQPEVVLVNAYANSFEGDNLWYALLGAESRE